MYVPNKFKVKDPETVISFMKKYSFATVVSQIDAQLEAAHIPLELEIKNDELYLSGHVAIGNNFTKAITAKQKILCIFSEPHAYVSSSWYDHINVPTWNYISVHASGQLIQLKDEALLNSIKKMVDHYEDGRPNRYRISDMSDEMLSANLKGLMGFELKVSEITAQFKLSQNRHDKDFKNIIAHLKESDDHLERSIALEMEKIRPQLNE